MAGIGDLLGNTVSNFTSGLVSAGSVVLQGLIFIIFIAIIGWFIIRPLTYKIRIVLWTERAGGIVEAHDKAKIIRSGLFSKSPVMKLKLLKRNLSLPVPDLKHFVRTEKGDTIYYYKYGELDYVPVIFKELVDKFKDLKFNPSEEDIRMWWVYEQKELIKRNTMKNTLLQYAPYLALGGVILLIIIVAWMLNGTMKDLITTGGQIAEAMKTASQNLNAAAHQGAVTPTPPI